MSWKLRKTTLDDLIPEVRKQAEREKWLEPGGRRTAAQRMHWERILFTYIRDDLVAVMTNHGPCIVVRMDISAGDMEGTTAQVCTGITEVNVDKSWLGV
jgi:hypothetical protein